MDANKAKELAEAVRDAIAKSVPQPVHKPVDGEWRLCLQTNCAYDCKPRWQAIQAIRAFDPSPFVAEASKGDARREVTCLFCGSQLSVPSHKPLTEDEIEAIFWETADREGSAEDADALANFANLATRINQHFAATPPIQETPHRETVCVPHKANLCRICFPEPPIQETEGLRGTLDSHSLMWPRYGAYARDALCQCMFSFGTGTEREIRNRWLDHVLPLLAANAGRKDAAPGSGEGKS